MVLPQNLHEMRFVEWNEIVRGLMEAWELAQRYGLEDYLEHRLQQDHDGSLVANLSRIGNELRRLQSEQEHLMLNSPQVETLFREILLRCAGTAPALDAHAPMAACAC